MYLRIMNPGTCDYRCFTLLGVSGSRGNEDKIGQFGSGAKFGTMALLRAGIKPTVCIGNLKMDFGFIPIVIDDRDFRQVSVKLQGKLDGKQVNRTEEQSYTLEHGIYDWRNLYMGLREYVSNAIDGSVENTGSYQSVIIDIVHDVRVRAGYTQVFIPLTEDVRSFVSILGDWFLHFNKKHTPKSEVMEKDKPGPAKIYYRGVLIRTIGEMSVFDYNVNHLTLDESRNSDEWSVRYSVAETLSKSHNKRYLKQVLRQTSEKKDLFEASISQYTWSSYREALADAFMEEFGEDAVICNEVTINHVEKKGFIPVLLNNDFMSVLRTVERLKTDTKVLDHAECQGFSVMAPTDSIINTSNKVWETFEYLELTNGKTKPQIKGMFSAMDGGKKTMGMYKDGIVYIDNNLGGVELTQTVIEEFVHHITGAGDLSRDIQDHAFLTIAKMIS